MKKGKIYFVWNYLNWGGAQIYLLAIMKIAKKDWDIEVLLPVGSSPEFIGFLKESDINYFFLKRSICTDHVTGIKGKLNRQLQRLYSELELFLHLRKIDTKRSVVHLETAPWQSWILLTLLNFVNIKTFVTIHNFPMLAGRFRSTLWKIRLKIVSRLSNVHIFTSNKDTKQKFKGLFEDHFWNKIDVTYTCVDPEQIEYAIKSNIRSNLRKNLNILESDLVVLSLGQFIDRKGRWTVLDAIKNILSVRQDIRFLWLMPELPSEADQKMIDNYGVGKWFMPVLSSSIGQQRTDILQFLQIADIFVLPSFVEGLPIALLEAMACGLPVVTTQINAIPEAVIHLETGILIEPGDHNALANSIFQLADDPPLRDKLGKAARSKVLSEFDERVASSIVISRYEEALKLNGSGISTTQNN